MVEAYQKWEQPGHVLYRRVEVSCIAMIMTQY